ncbi:hypothetical protein [Chryseobacterium paridis]|uniref:Phage integrase SAM-like domain-containing protein n=1 Tax=Chryseobacterium paridis TaxID=2800328 RepID=A0ABS1FXN4_9FLAO|nr:hypothetical protein [Chryseobacterium paridis]MBK1897189.1 hypothetical protein [Chryseobacterium paridis]
MENMFNEYPIKIQTTSMSEKDLYEQINEIKKLNDSGLYLSHFFNLLDNAHNRTTQFEKNAFTIDEWIKHYEGYGIITNSGQLIVFFSYLQRFHSFLISKSDKKYTFKSTLQKENFGLELIVLKTMENSLN